MSGDVGTGPSRLGEPPGPQVHVGNAIEDGVVHRGWFVGHFIPPSCGPSSTEAVEVKWGVHEAGEERPTWSPGDEATTLVLLIRGRFRIALPTVEVELDRPADYAVWGPGTAHRWAAVDASVVVTVRWPSRAGRS